MFATKNPIGFVSFVFGIDGGCKAFVHCHESNQSRLTWGMLVGKAVSGKYVPLALIRP